MNYVDTRPGIGTLLSVLVAELIFVVHFPDTVELGLSPFTLANLRQVVPLPTSGTRNVLTVGVTFRGFPTWHFYSLKNRINA